MAPTSNGQITGRDIRQASIRTLHLLDKNVTEPKLADLAVTIDKSEVVVDFASAQDFAQNVTLDTTLRNQVTAVLDVPSWAGLATVTGLLSLQVSGTVGDFNVSAAVVIADTAEPGNFATQAMKNGETHQVIRANVLSLSAPGSTLSVYGWAYITAGTSPQNSNGWRLYATASFAR